MPAWRKHKKNPNISFRARMPEPLGFFFNIRSLLNIITLKFLLLIHRNRIQNYRMSHNSALCFMEIQRGKEGMKTKHFCWCYNRLYSKNPSGYHTTTSELRKTWHQRRCMAWQCKNCKWGWAPTSWKSFPSEAESSCIVPQRIYWKGFKRCTWWHSHYPRGNYEGWGTISGIGLQVQLENYIVFCTYQKCWHLITAWGAISYAVHRLLW